MKVSFVTPPPGFSSPTLVHLFWLMWRPQSYLIDRQGFYVLRRRLRARQASFNRTNSRTHASAPERACVRACQRAGACESASVGACEYVRVLRRQIDSFSIAMDPGRQTCGRIGMGKLLPDKLTLYQRTKKDNQISALGRIFNYCTLDSSI